MYTVESNQGCTVLSDWIDVEDGVIHYDVIFDKYDITHVLLDNTDIIGKYIVNDENYEMIYEDSYFTLYERK